MGSGKTTTGIALAKRMGLSYVDLDERIVEQEGRSINEIFNMKGEGYFRNLETQLLNQTSKKTDQVVATGGGIVINPMNRERMQDTGFVIYLKTSLAVLWERVKEKKDRPLLKSSDPHQSLADLFRKRTPWYEEVSERFFLTDSKSPEAVALEIYKTCFESK